MKKTTLSKIRKTLYLSSCCFFIGLFGTSIALSVRLNDVEFILDAVPFVIYASFLFVLYLKEKELHKHIRGGNMLISIINGMAEDLHRYETLYGKLPEEEPKQETNESERTDESKD